MRVNYKLQLLTHPLLSAISSQRMSQAEINVFQSQCVAPRGSVESLLHAIQYPEDH